jgi:hypothetical protein
MDLHGKKKYHYSCSNVITGSQWCRIISDVARRRSGRAKSAMCSTKLTVDYALSFLEHVEKVLSKKDFSSFLEAIEDFKHQR